METQTMHDLIKKLFPLCRSITGKGVRETLKLVGTHIPLAICEVPSGTKVFDWEVPLEWNITDAYIKNSVGEKLIDFRNSNLHVASYSRPVHKTMPLEELKPHLYTLPGQPKAIPYRTTYYEDTWGFCLKHEDLGKFTDGQYEVCIDATLTQGSLTYGEYILHGSSKHEILISTHVCHPSMCNDNLSGIAVATYLAKYLSTQKLQYTYRFLFIPGTIGSITWLATHEEERKDILCGLVLTGVGDRGPITYKKTRPGTTEMDLVMEHVLKTHNKPYKTIDFYPYGYDERQYSAPGINLPVGTFMRTQHGTYPEYHTSLDNTDFVNQESLKDSLFVVTEVLKQIDDSPRYQNMYPKGEPNLGKRGLYKAMNTQAAGGKKFQLAMLWVLNLSDGKHNLLSISLRSGIDYEKIKQAAEALEQHRVILKI